MSSVSMLSNNIFETIPKVKIEIAIVPAKVPKPKIRAQTDAIINVGTDRETLKTNLINNNTGLFLFILFEAKTAKGKDKKQPI